MNKSRIVTPADCILEIDEIMAGLSLKNLYSLLGCARGLKKAQERDKTYDVKGIAASKSTHNNYPASS